MQGFLWGALITAMYTTKEGREITEKVVKVGLKAGNKLIKDRLNIDVNELLNDESEEKENDTQRDDA